MDFSYWWIPGADVTPGRPAGDYPDRGRAPADRDFGIATLREVLEHFPGVVLNLDIKQTAPVVAPYEEALARLLAEFDRTDDVIVASFLDPATDVFRQHAPAVPTSAGTVATAEAWRAVQAGEDLPEMAAVAFQVPERQGDLVVVDERFVAARPSCGQGRPRVDDQRHRVDGAAARSRRGRDHLGRAHRAVGRAGCPRRGLGGKQSQLMARRRPECGPAQPRPVVGVRPGVVSRVRRGQPRPQFGFLPWLAFFLVRSLRLTVRFDIRVRV